MDSGAEVYGTLVSDIQTDVEVTGKVIIPKTIESPYVSRDVPVKYCNYVDLKKIVGASVAWNQLWKETKIRTNTSNGLSYSANSDHSLTIDGTLSSSWSNIYTDASLYIELKPSNVYMLLCDTTNLPNGNFMVRCQTSSGGNSGGVLANRVVKTNANVVKGVFRIEATSQTEFDNIKIGKPIFVDLTAMFGTTIADYVYTLETTEAGTGIAWLQSYGFFTEDYYEYTENKIESVCTNGRTSKGITYPISAVELRGLFKLDNGELTVDGDEYEADGTITRKYGIVDLGSLEWTFGSRDRWTSPDLRNVIKRVEANNQMANIVSEQYVTYTTDQLYGNTSLIGIESDIQGSIKVRNGSTSDKPTGILIYELATPEIDLTIPFNERQKVGSTEQFDDYGVITGTRDVSIPVGNETDYLQNFAGQITGTLHCIEDGLAPSGYLSGSGNFIALHLDSDDWSIYTSVKVGLDPSQASGMVEILQDEEKIVVGKITDNEQVFIVESTDGEFTKTDVYDLSELVLETE